MNSPERDDRLLRTLVEAVEAETGDSFFRTLVRGLAEALGVHYAFVSELTQNGTHFRALALWARGDFGPLFEVPLAGTPCEDVLCGEMRHYPQRLQDLFPDDHGLADWRAVSYAGVPMVDTAGRVVGHFAIMHGAPLGSGKRALDDSGKIAAKTVPHAARQRTLAVC